MKLTPLDIRRQEFKRVMRGIDPEEVSVFLDMVAGEYERILREHKALAEERDELKRKVDELDSMKEAIQGAVVMARKSSDEALSQAKKEAELRLKEAEVESERILEDARRQAALFKKEINDIRNQRSILVGRLKSLLDGQMKMLEAYVGDWGQEERHMRLAAESDQPSRVDEVSYRGARPAEAAQRPRDAGITSPAAGQEEELPDVPADAPRMAEHSAAPEMGPARGQTDATVDRRLDEALRARSRPGNVDAPGWAGAVRPGPVQSKAATDRPSFLRPPRPTIDGDARGGRDVGPEPGSAERPAAAPDRPARELTPREDK